MAEQTFYLGSVGPLFYDDEDIPAGFSGNRRGMVLDSAATLEESSSVFPDCGLITEPVVPLTTYSQRWTSWTE